MGGVGRPFIKIRGEAMVKLIKMTTPEGKSADVHPDMVDEYKAGGYTPAKPSRKPASKKAK